MLFVLGQVYDRELGDPERAVETYSSIMDLDPEDYDAAQALDRLYQQLGRWYDLLAVLERQTELAPSPAEVVSLRYRIGELWREHLKDLGRAVEAYRQVLATDPIHEPTIRALEALMNGQGRAGAGGRRAGADLRERGRMGSRDRGLRGDGRRNSDDAVRTVELLSQHRRDRGAAAVAPERRLRRLRPRAARRSEQPGRARAPGTAGERDRALGQAGRRCSRARSRRSTNRAAPSICCCASRASTRRRPASSKRRSPPTGAPSTADPDSKQALVALDRLFGRAQQWDELAEIVRREIRIAPTDEDRVALTFRLAQIYELALVDMPKAVEAYRDILSADPTHAETRAALERMFMGGTMQLEIADVLEPLYRPGEEWEKLHRIHEVQLARLTDVGERQTLLRRLAEIAEQQAGRSGRGVRLVGGGGQGGAVVGAGARRAAAPGARDAPVGRLRHHDDGRDVARPPAGRPA